MSIVVGIVVVYIVARVVVFVVVPSPYLLLAQNCFHTLHLLGESCPPPLIGSSAQR